MRWSAIKAAGDGKWLLTPFSVVKQSTDKANMTNTTSPACVNKGGKLCVSSHIVHVGMVAPKMSMTLDVTVQTFVEGFHVLWCAISSHSPCVMSLQ